VRDDKVHGTRERRMKAEAAIIEMDVERDRKTCVALDLKVTGANGELAQWLLDHPRYSAPMVADWLDCGVTRVKDLRVWAQSGFDPNSHPNKKRQDRGHRRISGGEELNPLDNSESNDAETHDSDDVADAATVEHNVLYTLARMNEHARMFKRFFKLSSFDREAEARISAAIDRMIQKWRSTQATLTNERRRRTTS
jgi:hypothetical protein